MKLTALLSAALLFSICIFSQSFLGIRSGSYRGVNSVFSNPANIADSRYKFDINLFSINTSVSNNTASFSFEDLSNNFDEDFIKDQLLSGEGKITSLAEVDIIGPSFMIGGKKNSFSFTTRGRVWTNVANIDSKIANNLIDGDNNTSYPFNFNNAGNSLVSVNGWSEYGVSWGRKLMQKDQHFLNGGLTVKYLVAAMNASASTQNMNGTIEYDEVVDGSFLSNTTGQFGLNFGGADLGDFDPADLVDFSGGGVGMDIGFVYEWRPGKENSYKLKAGLAVLDIGKLKYNRNATESANYNVGITGNEKFYLQELEDASLDEYNEILQNYPEYFSPVANEIPNSYQVALPSTLQVDVDYHFHNGFYINAAAQIPLSSKVAYDGIIGYTSFTLTPRYEGRIGGVYLPFNTNSISGLNIGAAFRLGPLFVGSGSALTALFGNSKQVDAYIGLRFGMLQKKSVK